MSDIQYLSVSGLPAGGQQRDSHPWYSSFAVTVTISGHVTARSGDLTWFDGSVVRTYETSYIETWSGSITRVWARGAGLRNSGQSERGDYTFRPLVAGSDIGSGYGLFGYFIPTRPSFFLNLYPAGFRCPVFNDWYGSDGSGYISPSDGEFGDDSWKWVVAEKVYSHTGTPPPGYTDPETTVVRRPSPVNNPYSLYGKTGENVTANLNLTSGVDFAHSAETVPFGLTGFTHPLWCFGQSPYNPFDLRGEMEFEISDMYEFPLASDTRKAVVQVVLS